MYISDCVAYRNDVQIGISTIDETHRLSVKFGESDLGLTLSTEQLLTLSEVIEWYLFKRDDPAATLEEILEGLG